MVADHFRDWPNADKFNASAAHLHALGAANLMYNRLEDAMSLLFVEVLGGPRDVSDAIYSRLTNHQRMDILRTLMPLRTLEPALADCIDHAILCFDICNDNRNTLMHIIHDHQLPPSDLVILAKKKSSNKKKGVFYVLPVVDLRRVADEMKATYEFVMGLSLYSFRVWYESKDPSTRTGVLQEVIAAAGPNTLPEKPPRPDKLTPLELEEGR